MQCLDSRPARLYKADEGYRRCGWPVSTPVPQSAIQWNISRARIRKWSDRLVPVQCPSRSQLSAPLLPGLRWKRTDEALPRTRGCSSRDQSPGESRIEETLDI